MVKYTVEELCHIIAFCFKYENLNENIDRLQYISDNHKITSVSLKIKEVNYYLENTEETTLLSDIKKSKGKSQSIEDLKKTTPLYKAYQLYKEDPQKYLDFFNEPEIVSDLESDEEIEEKYDDNGKMVLICLPCQAGKSQLCLNMMKGKDTNHFFLTSNSKLERDQIEKRAINTGYFQNVSVLKGKDNVFTKHILRNENFFGITCCNKVNPEQTRLQSIIDTIKIANAFNITLNKSHKFNIWIDEADKNYNMLDSTVSNYNKTFLELLNQYDCVENIYMITATPKKIFKKYKNQINAYLMAKTVTENYHSLAECIFSINNEKDFELFLEKCFSDSLISNEIGNVIFCPGQVKNNTHNIVKEHFLAKDLSVFVVNKDGVNFFSNNKKQMKKVKKKLLSKKMKNKDLNFKLENIYKECNLHNENIVITGNLCIGRAISINNKSFIITHAYFHDSITKNKCNRYQLAGRPCGNIKELEPYHKAIENNGGIEIHCSKEFKKDVLSYEEKATKMSQKLFRHYNGVEVGVVIDSDYNSANCKYQKPIYDILSGKINEQIIEMKNIMNKFNIDYSSKRKFNLISDKIINKINDPRLKKYIKDNKIMERVLTQQTKSVFLSLWEFQNIIKKSGYTTYTTLNKTNNDNFFRIFFVYDNEQLRLAYKYVKKEDESDEDNIKIDLNNINDDFSKIKIEDIIDE